MLTESCTSTGIIAMRRRITEKEQGQKKKKQGQKAWCSIVERGSTFRKQQVRLTGSLGRA